MLRARRAGLAGPRHEPGSAYLAVIAFGPAPKLVGAALAELAGVFVPLRGVPDPSSLAEESSALSILLSTTRLVATAREVVRPVASRMLFRMASRGSLH